MRTERGFPNGGVVIIGAGLAGLTLAIQLRRQFPSLPVTILERNSLPLKVDKHKVGESTSEVGATYLRNTIGLGEHLEQEHIRKFGLRFFLSSADNKSLDQRMEIGQCSATPIPTYQIDRVKLENHIAVTARRCGVTILENCQSIEVEALASGPPQVVAFKVNGLARIVKCDLLVDASGASAVVRRSLRIDSQISHNANAVWMKIAARLSVDDWMESPCQSSREAVRWRSTNHLAGTGYWVWIIPLPDNATSVGIVTAPQFHDLSDMKSTELAINWLLRNEPQCGAAIMREKGSITNFSASKKYARGCKQVFSDKGWFLTGNAGVFADPLYSPGIDSIAISNIAITSIIRAYAEGKSYRTVASVMNRVFLSIFKSSLTTYQGMYAVLGHPQAMPLKVLWDTAVYWGLIAPLFISDNGLSVVFFRNAFPDIQFISKLHQAMQKVFLLLCETQAPFIKCSADLYEFDLLKELNAELAAQTPEEELPFKLKRTRLRLTELATEIASHVPGGRQYLEREFGNPLPVLGKEAHFSRLYSIFGMAICK